jgi:hypothetical protein
VSDVIEPSWEAFGPCERCGAAEGAPCKDLRLGDWPHWSHLIPKMRNPHKGRRQVKG